MYSRSFTAILMFGVSMQSINMTEPKSPNRLLTLHCKILAEIVCGDWGGCFAPLARGMGNGKRRGRKTSSQALSPLSSHLSLLSNPFLLRSTGRSNFVAMTNFTIAIHGGAGTILKKSLTEEKEKAYKSALQDALDAGYAILAAGGKALDAVQAAVVSLEDCPLFNAGKGSVFTHDEKHEMDASIMDGSSLNAGAVAGVRNVRNPVLLARAVMEKSEFVLLSGKGAEEFAKSVQLPFETDDYFFSQFRYDQLKEIIGSEKTILDHSEKKFGTVGAVALDGNGNLAAATSTGGMTNKRYGRIGDTPVIGSGTYANNKTCAVSCTGHGEFFLRSVVAYDISCLMEYKGMSLRQACEKVVMEKLVSIGGEGGIVAVDSNGNHALVFNSEGMYRGMRDSSGQNLTAIYR